MWDLNSASVTGSLNESHLSCALSVASESSPSNVKARAIVKYCGRLFPWTSGEWICSSDGRTPTCSHTEQAKKYLLVILGVNYQEELVNSNMTDDWSVNERASVSSKSQKISVWVVSL